MNYTFEEAISILKEKYSVDIRFDNEFGVSVHFFGKRLEAHDLAIAEFKDMTKEAEKIRKSKTLSSEEYVINKEIERLYGERSRVLNKLLLNTFDIPKEIEKDLVINKTYNCTYISWNGYKYYCGSVLNKDISDSINKFNSLIKHHVSSVNIIPKQTSVSTLNGRHNDEIVMNIDLVSNGRNIYNFSVMDNDNHSYYLDELVVK